MCENTSGKLEFPGDRISGTLVGETIIPHSNDKLQREFHDTMSRDCLSACVLLQHNELLRASVKLKP